MRKKALFVLLSVLVLLVLSSCAPESPMTNAPQESGNIAGFWGGLWDGIIAPFAFIINLIAGKGGAFYNVFNNGGWYNTGFVLGAGLLFGGGTVTVK